MTTPTHRPLITSRDGGRNSRVVTFFRLQVSDRVWSSFLYFYSYGLLYVSYYFDRPIDNPLFGTSYGSVHGHDRLDCVPPRQAITLTLGLGVMGRREISKGMEKPSGRMIEGRESPIGAPLRQRVYGYAKPKADLGTISDASCITHG